MQSIIDDLNTKLNDFQNSLNNNINNDKKLESSNNKNLNNSKTLTLLENSIDNEIINYDSKEIKITNIENYKKENEELNQKYKSLKSQFDKYKNESQIELSIYKNEFQALKKKSEEKENFNKNKEKFTPDKYTILCDKNYEKLKWFLLIPKDIKFNNNYENLIWVEESNIINIDEFNNFETEIEIQNNIINNYVKKLEQKEDIISRLNSKLAINDRNIKTNLSNDAINNNYISSLNFNSGISLEKYNILLNQLNDTEEKFKILQLENIKLKENKNRHKKRNSEKKNVDNSEGSNKLGYDKNYILHIKEENEDNKKNGDVIQNNIESIEDNKNDDNENESENYSETDTEISELKNELESTKMELIRLSNECKNLENKIKILRESFSNLLIKMNIPKKFKEEIKEILKLFEFTESEILFIVDKKKQYY